MGRVRWIVGFALALSGCLQLEETVAIAADGSGTQDLVMTMPDATLAEARRAASVNQTAVADPLALFTRATLEKELTAAGIELVDYTSSAKDGAHRVELKTTFGTLARLRGSPLAGSAAEWQFAAGPLPGTIEATLYPQGKNAWVEARAKAEAMKTAVDAVATEFFDRRREQLVGLDLMLRLRMPGKVLRLTRNLEQTGDCEVTAHIAQDQIRTPEDLVRRLAPRFQVVFDASGCPNFPIDG